MPCSQCDGIEKVFNDELASRELRDHRKSGPAKTTRVLVNTLKSYGLDGGALIDVGGGVGAIQQSLIEAGVARVVSVDASSGYSEVARKLAEQEGYADRVTRIHGDFTRIAPTLDPADVVTLDRVLCCFDDMPALVAASASRTARYWGAVFPRSFWWLRGGAVVVRAILALVRFPMRFFIHKTEDVDAVLHEHGLSERFRRNMGIWQVVIYGRG